MSSLLAWLVGLAVLALVGTALWLTWRRSGRSVGPDLYLTALEHWVAGDLAEAARLLREVIQNDPDAVDPYLQLGNLLREQGDAARAAVLHRGLTVRRDLPRGKKVVVGLSLAEDLLALERWQEAASVLDTLQREASALPSWWKSRFLQYHGQGDAPNAARTLKHSVRYLPERDRAWFQQAYASYQLDRALEAARAGDAGAARPRLKDVEKFPAARPRIQLVKAMLAAAEDDPEGALTVAAEELLDNPQELEVFLPVLRDVLLRSGHYARTIPILEQAVQAENAPPSLWIDLALLYEKLDQRDQALQLLESKRGRPNFTPNAAAPYLRLLAAEQPRAAFTTVWRLLSKPPTSRAWTCRHCGQSQDRLRWFCPACHSFDTFRAHLGRREGD